MAHSQLFGRRVHIAGSIDRDVANAPKAEVDKARTLITGLVKQLIKRGANFVVPVDAEPTRPSDDEPITFDWTVWTAIADNLHLRPTDVPGPMVIAVQHYKTEDQIPDHRVALWERLQEGPHVRVENAAYWNMASKRMEAQAEAGDILIALGGGEGVLFLANLYHAAGKPVVPLNVALSAETAGARRLYAYGLTKSRSSRLFRTETEDPHHWLNRIRFPERQSVEDRVNILVELLEDLEPPPAFVVRLLNDKVTGYDAVEDHFETVVKPVFEGELGYRLVVVDGEQAFEFARVDEEIFAKLHRSRIVLADLTGLRPNCFIEMGYALGRPLPTMVMAEENTPLPFDITTFSGLLWTSGGSVQERRDALRAHWNAIRNRPPLVPAEPLIA